MRYGIIWGEIAMKQMNLETLLKEQNTPLSTSKLHVIRQPSAAEIWRQSVVEKSDSIEHLCLLETAKLKFAESSPKVFIPIISPLELNNGPPELPPKIGAVFCIMSAVTVLIL